MKLVSEVIQEHYGSVPKATKATGQHSAQLYRWIKMGAMTQNNNVYRWVDDALTINYEHTGAWIYSGKLELNK